MRGRPGSFGRGTGIATPSSRHRVDGVEDDAIDAVISTPVDDGGMAVQVALADVCGDPGYEDCWEDCPLPDPMEFNHNALFHALYAAGLLALAVGVLCDTADSWTATEKPTDAAKELERV